MHDAASGTQPTDPADKQEHSALPPTRHGRTTWRVLRFGCLGILLLMCGLVSALTFALQSGPVNLALPFNNTVKIGSDDFVLSNYNFKDGNTYYFDLNGNGTRNILQLEYLEDTNSLQLVLHTSTKGDREENQLLQINLP